ncbi:MULTISPECIES: peptidoglycan-binding protein LysM [unclassified Mesorhizobium]|uniref:peptidoglycan-binding protein LysM n=1 Tax=unclassified Mesorhizobium TaxID=325217 RepID=UPI0006FED653|nr:MULTISPECIES: peptidoglycan-binding protein LysM [unclassified Mesorhizobium]KQZ15297.1 peptidoglycan-binding protein LysM [Mesorhizobium sp. Root1471]KQZ37805.1 peptidoglycan-binding protein LysM [Mesorhizobium sp. Root554]MDR7033541.1 nucleoid-associated protein YgaU [Mesorhizobium sp. BE184]
MGMFDFVKSVGKKLGIGGDDPTPDAGSLKKELDSHKLGTDQVQVEVRGDTAVLKGVVKDQSIFEKAIIAVGNTLGVSKVQADELKVVAPESSVKLDGNVDMTELVKASAPAKQPVFYTVKKGDNLSKIAEAQYGKGKASKYTVIFEANKPMLTHPDKIYPGQVLRIPDIETA